MSSPIWTATAVASEICAAAFAAWRAVESQHAVSTRRLVDTLDEQMLLEEILEQHKPPLPEGAAQVHFLLATPFRYVSPTATRFRTATDPGVFYGAEEIRTACAELGYWRWRFLTESPDLPGIDWTPQTLFSTPLRAGMIDLRRPPFAADHALWTAEDYRATQQFAQTCRAAGVAAIRYESVRDPERGGCVAVLSLAAFAGRPDETHSQNWKLRVQRDSVIWRRDSIYERAEFVFDPGIWSQ